MSDKIVCLNVGGTTFETTSDTLRLDGVDNFFTVLLSDRTPSLRDSTGAYFIDRDPDYFRVILRLMRTKTLDPRGIPLKYLYNEALFYSLDSITKIIQNEITSEHLIGWQSLPHMQQKELISDHYVALFDHENAVDSLPFSKGDQFQVLEFTTEEWYLARKLKDNTEGFIPVTFVALYGSLNTYPWYFEGLTRKDAGVMLCKSMDGTYLVRRSETKAGCFSLSVRVADKGKEGNPFKKANYNIKHYIIRHSKKDGTYFLRGNMTFENIDVLLQYYKNNKAQLGYQLTEPVKPTSSNTDLVTKTGCEVDYHDIQQIKDMEKQKMCTKLTCKT